MVEKINRGRNQFTLSLLKMTLITHLCIPQAELTEILIESAQTKQRKPLQ